MDDGCDAILYCICLPLAAIFCCKLCKDKSKSTNGIGPDPDSDYGREPAARIYGSPMDNPGRSYPGQPRS